MDSNTYSGTSAGLAGGAGRGRRPAGRQDLDRLTDVARAERVLVLRRLANRVDGQWLTELAGVDARGAAGAEQGLPGRLDRRVAAGPAADGGRCGQQPGADRPGPVPWPPDRHRPGPDRRGPSRWPTPRCWPTAPRTCPTTWPPRPNRCCSRRPGGWTRPGCAGSSAICGWSPTLRAPTAGRAAPRSVGGVAGPDLRRHGGRRGAAGARSRRDAPGGAGTVGPPRRRPRHPLRRPTDRRRPDRVGPPQPGSRPAAAIGWGPAPAGR